MRDFYHPSVKANIVEEEAERMQELEDEREFCEMLVSRHEMAKPAWD